MELIFFSHIKIGIKKFLIEHIKILIVSYYMKHMYTNIV